MTPSSGTFVVTAAGSGHGKTLFTLALCAALRARGLHVQPYKIGPDYIDARFYARVAGRPAYNVDVWLDGEAGVRAHVAATRGNADVALFEGMMGLYDGATDGTGSTADVARILGARVIAVIDCWTSSQTAAAVALGLRAYDPAIELAGVILNRVAGDDHERAVRAACVRANLPVLATVRYNAAYEAADRRLGLDVAAVERRAEAVGALARDIHANASLMALFVRGTAPRRAAAAAAEGADDVVVSRGAARRVSPTHTTTRSGSPILRRSRHCASRAPSPSHSRRCAIVRCPRARAACGSAAAIPNLSLPNWKQTPGCARRSRTPARAAYRHMRSAAA